MEALDQLEGLALILLCPLLSNQFTHNNFYDDDDDDDDDDNHDNEFPGCTLWTVAISILLVVTGPTPSSPPFLTRSTQTLWENRLEPRSSTSCLFLLLLHLGSSSERRRWLCQPQRRGIALWLATLGNLPNPGQLLPLRGAG